MKMIEVDFYPDNQELIYQGLKTSTLRTEPQAQKIGLDKSESGVITIRDKQFVVNHVGLVGVDEVGGKDLVWKSEGFLHTSPKFHSTWMFLQGNRKLHYYVISELKEGVK